MVRRATAAVLMSIVGHVVVGSIGLEEAQRRALGAEGLNAPAEAAIGAAAAIAGRSARIEGDRRTLVAEAQADLARGHLALGAFLLRANELDAEERGLPFDHGEAAARYADRVRALQGAFAERADLRSAAPEVFSDLRYRGEPGGFMGDALLEGSGSCEQIAQLVAAAVYDAGKPGSIALRFYGRPTSDGISHVAPIAVEGGEEFDLMSGRPAIRRGARINAEDLVAIYARAHGLGPALASTSVTGPRPGDPKAGYGEGAAAGGVSTPARPTLIAGFPPNDDLYPGSLPLYAARAVKDPSDEATEPEGDDTQTTIDQARECAFTVRLAWLSPPHIEVRTDPADTSGGVVLEPHRQPKPSQLERKSSILRAAETLATDPRSDAADRAMAWACLAALGASTAIDFELAGERRFAEAALEKSRVGREEGAKALAVIQGAGEEGERARRRLSGDFAGKSWLLLALKGGDDVVLRILGRDETSEDWGRVGSLAALVLWPATQDRALALVEALPLREQAEVMHEIFHAHDHMRPWASNFDLGDESNKGEASSGAAFRRAYRVFRGVAFRLWEGQRGIDEVIEGLFRESKAAGISRAWEAALIDYCSKNTLGLYSVRASGISVVRALQRAVKRCGDPSLAPLGRQLDYIESQSALNARTLADALRMR